MFTNGKDSGSNTINWKEDPRDYIEKVGMFGISLDGARTGNDITFTVTMDAVKTTTDSQDLRLFVAAVMDTIKYPGSANGLTEHHNAVIELLTGLTGKSINLISGSDTKESFTWTMRSEWIDHPDFSWQISGLKVVAWIQDYKNKDILQVREYLFD